MHREHGIALDDIYDYSPLTIARWVSWLSPEAALWRAAAEAREREARRNKTKSVASNLDRAAEIFSRRHQSKG